MINLKVDNNQVVLPAGASISIEKNSPVLNDKVGAFSTPFPLPTAKNQKLLGYPGRLERAANLSAKSFILDENGIQILRGQVEFGKVTSIETGIILQSGSTEFSGLMEKKKLTDLNFGGEPFPASGLISNPPEEINDILNIFTDANATPNGKYVCVPYVVKDSAGVDSVINPTNIDSHITTATTTETYRVDHYGLQFYLSFLLTEIYKNAGLHVIENQLIGSSFEKVVLFSKILTIKHKVFFDSTYSRTIDTVTSPTGQTLHFSDLMPDILVLDFIAEIKNLLCISIDVNEQSRTVSIYFKKEIFLTQNKVLLNAVELKGWEHSEEKAKQGFAIGFADQSDELATKYDYKIIENVAGKINLPEANDPKYRNEVVHDIATNRDYKLTEDETDWSWKPIGRLKPYREANAEETIDINVKVPVQAVIHDAILNLDIEMPSLDETLEKDPDPFKNIGINLSISRGMISYGSKQFPTITFDYTLFETVLFTNSLRPSYLYETVYKEFINWKTYRARECTKYLQLTLAEVVQLQWRKRYVISGIAILLNQVNFEVPYRGIVKVNGFTT